MNFQESQPAFKWLMSKILELFCGSYLWGSGLGISIQVGASVAGFWLKKSAFWELNRLMNITSQLTLKNITLAWENYVVYVYDALAFTILNSIVNYSC